MAGFVSYVMAQIVSRSPLKKLVSFTLAMCALVLAYLVAAPWIPPSTITRVMHNAQFVVGEYHMNWRQVVGATVLALLLAPACWLRRLNVSLQTAFSFFSIFCLALVVGWEGLGMALRPQPHRYHFELDLSLGLLGISLLPSILRFAKPNKLFPWLLLPLAIFLVIQTRMSAHSAQQQRSDRCYGHSGVKGFGLAS
jgi:hypothetical protein